MKISFPLFVACSMLLLCTACSKNKNLSTKGQLLVAGKWLVSGQTASLNYMGRDTTMDVPMDDCDKDDFVLFTANGRASIDESANKCTDDDQVERCSWALLDNDTRLALVDSNPDTFTIMELSTTLLKYRFTKPNSSGTPVTYIYTYTNIK